MSTNTSTKKILIAYHANCIDGFTSAYITARGCAEDTSSIDLLPMHYTDASSDELVTKMEYGNYDELFIVDFSVSVGVLTVLGLMAAEVVLLDHHKTAFEKYMEAGYKVTANSYYEDTICGVYVVLDNSHSGAGMCWNYMNSNKAAIPLLALYVQDYDLWRFEYGEETRWINKYLTTQDQTLDRWTELEEAFEDADTRADIMRAGAELQVVHDKKVAEIAAGAGDIEILGHKGSFIECPYEFTNDVGHELAKKSGTFGMMFQWPDTKEGLVKFSLRSEDAFDVTTITKQFGGGGHKNAGGFTLTVNEARMLLGDDYA